MPSAKQRLPDPDKVLLEMTLVSPGAGAAPAVGATREYRILRTLEVDEYEKPIPTTDILALGQPQPAPPNNNFAGKSRKAAKLSIANAPLEQFADIKALIATLQGDKTMKKKNIAPTSGSNRVTEEKRNVRVTAWLYAASLEDDNDYHLIIGRDPSKPATYMTAEISGLPPSSSSSFTKLEAARSAYQSFFGNKLPGPSYDFYDPPIEIEVEGSLFWDVSHASGGRPGPSKLRSKMPVIWEIHPVTDIVFEP